MKGKFIAFEGCEGAGKSTQMRLLSEYLAKKRVAHAVTREPGGGEISEAIRKVILNGKFTSMTDECEALLYAAARVQHLADTVEPALNEGKLVLCDRYIFSSYAYQGPCITSCPTLRCFWTFRPYWRSRASTAPTKTTAWNRRAKPSTKRCTRGIGNF